MAAKPRRHSLFRFFVTSARRNAITGGSTSRLARAGNDEWGHGRTTAIALRIGK